ncbi:Protein of unknown function [Pyronema omphalodes CBS 100304]|uniref:Uncharacterized protein n=1 Tax=Pyronema omphalodes (strain CBS 100304) TaxID=1076935 RepID=U4LK30_PYROM|nr:Protein of unknown function [Pyronema omphalodes CBS 100304]
MQVLRENRKLMFTEIHHVVHKTPVFLDFGIHNAEGGCRTTSKFHYALAESPDIYTVWSLFINVVLGVERDDGNYEYVWIRDDCFYTVNITTMEILPDPAA